MHDATSPDMVDTDAGVVSKLEQEGGVAAEMDSQQEDMGALPTDGQAASVEEQEQQHQSKDQLIA